MPNMFQFDAALIVHFDGIAVTTTTLFLMIYFEENFNTKSICIKNVAEMNGFAGNLLGDDESVL